jgi:hypothetical protein
VISNAVLLLYFKKINFALLTDYNLKEKCLKVELYKYFY